MAPVAPVDETLRPVDQTLSRDDGTVDLKLIMASATPEIKYFSHIDRFANKAINEPLFSARQNACAFPLIASRNLDRLLNRSLQELSLIHI